MHAFLVTHPPWRRWHWVVHWADSCQAVCSIQRCKGWHSHCQTWPEEPQTWPSQCLSLTSSLCSPCPEICPCRAGGARTFFHISFFEGFNYSASREAGRQTSGQASQLKKKVLQYSCTSDKHRPAQVRRKQIFGLVGVYERWVQGAICVEERYRKIIKSGPQNLKR